ncbi:MAG: TetR/AcrR family transcriptional regulator [Roseiarcus sp.]|jgi:TetR/AcrR family transcriptional repressor of nem operon
MRITRQQAQANKARVVESAAALFRAKGFEHVNIADLMQAAGLTHGGFYNHFDSKDELEAEACAHIFERSVAAVAAIADLPDSARRAEAFDAYRRSYVSAEARDAHAARCPMVAFAGDVARQPDVVREEYAAGLRRYLDAFARAAAEEGRSRAGAIAQFAALTGALTLARSVATADPALSDEILAAAVAALGSPVR